MKTSFKCDNNCTKVYGTTGNINVFGTVNFRLRNWRMCSDPYFALYLSLPRPAFADPVISSLSPSVLFQWFSTTWLMHIHIFFTRAFIQPITHRHFASRAFRFSHGFLQLHYSDSISRRVNTLSILLSGFETLPVSCTFCMARQLLLCRRRRAGRLLAERFSHGRHWHLILRWQLLAAPRRYLRHIPHRFQLIHHRWSYLSSNRPTSFIKRFTALHQTGIYFLTCVFIVSNLASS